MNGTTSTVVRETLESCFNRDSYKNTSDAEILKKCLKNYDLVKEAYKKEQDSGIVKGGLGMKDQALSLNLLKYMEPKKIQKTFIIAEKSKREREMQDKKGQER